MYHGGPKVSLNIYPTAFPGVVGEFHTQSYPRLEIRLIGAFKQHNSFTHSVPSISICTNCINFAMQRMYKMLGRNDF